MLLSKVIHPRWIGPRQEWAILSQNRWTCIANYSGSWLWIQCVIHGFINSDDIISSSNNSRLISHRNSSNSNRSSAHRAPVCNTDHWRDSLAMSRRIQLPPWSESDLFEHIHHLGPCFMNWYIIIKYKLHIKL